MNTDITTNFSHRHIGPDNNDTSVMLQSIGVSSLDELIDKIVPSKIRLEKELNLPAALSEFEYLQHIRQVASYNKVFKSLIGVGYYNTITPSVILRNLFENPGWYTQYTPYQAEIAQGRLESLLNFQTMIMDLTKLDVANASLLDEGTAAAEAMALLFHAQNGKRKHFFVSETCLPQTIDLLKTRATPIGIELTIGSVENFDFSDKYFSVILQYPDANGLLTDYTDFINKAHANDIKIILAADILSLAIVKAPGELGADIAVGSAQRFGVPLGYGGPHAAYFACKDEFKRLIPGRLIGVSIDADGKPAYRMALQTREQHIRREKATSNICTAQALLANIAAMYAVYHGADGIKEIANTIHAKAASLHDALSKLSYTQINTSFFDTLCIRTVIDGKNVMTLIHQNAIAKHFNLRYIDEEHVSLSIDETISWNDMQSLVEIFAHAVGKESISIKKNISTAINKNLVRTSEYLTHPVFNRHHTESEMMRYMKYLENKDLALNTSMIALGSCTMKLNAATQMIPVSLPEFSAVHPFAPLEQVSGYIFIIKELEKYLCEITGFDACSLQPNSGAQGEYAGLMVIKKYHEDRGDHHRDIVLIPQSAHGTNPASAVMAGFKVVVTKCDDNGNIDLDDLRSKAEEHKNDLAALMVTYPSTHGVFEEEIKVICDMIHTHGGQVYMDGANMNAQVGLTSPASIGADVNHINLHKTFSIPHGGGGPGMGPICVAKHLSPYLPSHAVIPMGGEKGISAISAAQWGSASILLISYAYIRLLGSKGCTDATKYAILNANYMKSKLEKEYSVLYQGKNGLCAHEFILDMREYKKYGIEVEDVAKRLMDYGFHAPTVSFPVAGTLMIEPTESEPKEELDRFIVAMLSIKNEIQEVIEGKADQKNNVLKNAPHTIHTITADEWTKPYSRTKAAFPAAYLLQHKFWPSVSRINNTHGDRNLICACPPMEAYAEA